MLQTQSAVSPVSTTRIRRHDWCDHQEAQRPYYIGGATAPGQGYTSCINPFYARARQRLGGQHVSPGTDDDGAALKAFEQAKIEALEGGEVQPW